MYQKIFIFCSNKNVFCIATTPLSRNNKYIFTKIYKICSGFSKTLVTFSNIYRLKNSQHCKDLNFFLEKRKYYSRYGMKSKVVYFLKIDLRNISNHSFLTQNPLIDKELIFFYGKTVCYSHLEIQKHFFFTWRFNAMLEIYFVLLYLIVMSD